jgi:hypothetical protein
MISFLIWLTTTFVGWTLAIGIIATIKEYVTW